MDNRCTSCNTSISDAEVEQKEEASHLWHIRYPVVGEEGKVILRASGTENLIRLTVSAKDQKVVDKYIEELSSLIISEAK